MDIKQKISELLKSTKLATISTANPKDLQPESALIAFAEDNSLTLYFQTGNNTRKYRNLQLNPKVALVIGFDRITVQYEGRASEMIDDLEIAKTKRLFKDKNSPTSQEFLNRPNIAFFEIRPTWVGYSDYSQPKTFVAELTRF